MTNKHTSWRLSANEAGAFLLSFGSATVARVDFFFQRPLN